jgi:hypothetical protein
VIEQTGVCLAGNLFFLMPLVASPSVLARCIAKNIRVLQIVVYVITQRMLPAMHVRSTVWSVLQVLHAERVNMLLF